AARSSRARSPPGRRGGGGPWLRFARFAHTTERSGATFAVLGGLAGSRDGGARETSRAWSVLEAESARCARGEREVCARRMPEHGKGGQGMRDYENAAARPGLPCVCFSHSEK